MSNLGLEKALEGMGVGLVRTQVGDRYVVETMRARGFNLGGEQSGHLVFLDHNSTGDGLITALQTLAIMRRHERPLSELVARFPHFPQVLVNVRVAEKRPFESVPALMDAVRKVAAELGGGGRALLRSSGTESKARVMVEGEDEARVREIANDVADAVRRHLGEADGDG